jgi:uncharacterized membrane protein
MDFLLWVARSLHVFGVVVWCGGLMFQAAVTFPVARVEDREFDPFTVHVARRFQPFVWMCVWTVLVTGVALMLFDPRFVFFRFETWWAALLGVKQVVFFVMVFFSFGYARMLARVVEMVRRNDARDDVVPFYRQMLMFGKINVALAIAALLLAAGMKSA